MPGLRGLLTGDLLSMMRHHFAIFTLMGNGHVNPFVPLCSELIARGHRITFPTTNRYSRIVSATGAKTLPYRETAVSSALRAENEARSRSPRNNAARLETTELEWTHFV